MMARKIKMQITHTDAHYRCLDEALDDNVLIAALPPKMSKHQFREMMTVAPNLYRVSSAADSDTMVIAVINEFRKLRFALPDHYLLYEKIYQLIVQGYVNRNPQKPEFIAWQYDIATGRNDDERHVSTDGKSTADTIFVTGPSGFGKTTTCDKIIWQSFPKVISHNKDGFKEPQIVYVKVDMPHDASRGELIHRMLKDIDKSLEVADYKSTNYAASIELKNGRRVPIAKMVDILHTVLNRHHVGVFIIDEFQNLEVASERYRDEMIQFFDDLSNSLEIPHIKIGTPNTILLFLQKIRHLRRLGEVFEFTRVTEKHGVADLLSLMFSNLPDQISIKSVELVKERLMTHSVGVPAILLGLWESNLKFALINNKAITVDLVTTLFNKEFALLKRVLEEIGSNKESSMLDLLTVHQLFRQNKKLAFKQFEKFIEDEAPKGVAAQKILEGVLTYEKEGIFSDNEKQKLKGIKKDLENSLQNLSGPQTLEHSAK